MLNLRVVGIKLATHLILSKYLIVITFFFLVLHFLTTNKLRCIYKKKSKYNKQTCGALKEPLATTKIHHCDEQCKITHAYLPLGLIC